jgi:hypothetical protein
VRPSGWVIWFGVDHSGPWWTGSFIENPAFTGVTLSNVRVIMVIMRVPMVELLCHAVMEQVLVLEYLLPSMCEHQMSGPVMSGIKLPCSPRAPALGLLAWYREPLGVATGGPDTC